MADKQFRRRALAQPQAVTELRHEVVALARAYGAGENALEAVALAVSEAVTNAVVHAYEDVEPGPVIVEAWHEDGDLIVIVYDEGGGMLPIPNSRGLGLGLPLMTLSADDLHIAARRESPGTMVSMRFSLHRSGNPTPESYEQPA